MGFSINEWMETGLTPAKESVPEPIMGNHMPDLIKISLFKLAGYGDTKYSLIQQHPVHGDQPAFIHQLMG